MRVVVDTSFLINFLCIDRMNLIGRYWDSFYTTKHVAEEVIRPNQKIRYMAAFTNNYLVEELDLNQDEVNIYDDFRMLIVSGRPLGAGECSAIAIALNRGYQLAIDDKPAIKHALTKAPIYGKELSVLCTRGIILNLIASRVLTVEQANNMRTDWKDNYNFKTQLFNEPL